jgi:hypothetical protein
MSCILAGSTAQHWYFVLFFMYCLMMTLLGLKHVGVIKKIKCFSGLPVTLTSAHAGGY